MFIYNVTTKVNWPIHDAWLEWMYNVHMPALIETKCFHKYQLLKLYEQDDTEGPTYVAQYFAESKALYNRFVQMHAVELRNESIVKWGDHIISFKTLMEVIS